MNNHNQIEQMTKVMDRIEKKFDSCTMCTAKWLQSTITLYNGHTHSCHHPSPHKIPLDELVGNPSALHNTNHKKVARAEMLAGERPSECEYCWKIEDLPGNHVSDRTYKSSNMEWSVPHLERIVKSGADGNITPSYVEVAFDNTCNFKCSYCSADVSSKWGEEIDQYGPYPTSSASGDIEWIKKIGKFPIPNKDFNPYIEAFWKWWPTIKESLQTFRITGGEPLLSKHTWRLFEDIIEKPRPDLTLSINTNMGVPDVFIEKLIKNHNAMISKVKHFSVFTSAEAANEQAEYIRFGMYYKKFMENVRRFLSETEDSQINFMVTFNAMSVTSFEQFLMDVLALRKEFNTNNAYNRVPMMINYLRWPNYQDVRVLPIEIRQKYAANLKFVMEKHSIDDTIGIFYLEELDQIERLGKFMCEELPDLDRQREDFGKFFTEYDRRRGTDFKKTFPELADFFEDCK